MLYLAQLERFGYELTAIGKTEDEARKTLIKEYTKTYREINGTSPAKDMWDDTSSYLRLAKEEVNVTEIDFGKVAWL